MRFSTALTATAAFLGGLAAAAPARAKVRLQERDGVEPLTVIINATYKRGDTIVAEGVAKRALSESKVEPLNVIINATYKRDAIALARSESVDPLNVIINATYKRDLDERDEVEPLTVIINATYKRGEEIVAGTFTKRTVEDSAEPLSVIINATY